MPPLIESQLRAALRRTRTGQRRFWIGLIGVLLTVLHLFFQGNLPASASSQDLFKILLLLSSANAVFETVHFSIDLVARERRNRTLGLLILTGLSSSEIFLSKLAGSLVVQLENGLALLPCFAVSFVLGGVPASAFLAAAAFVPSLTILTLTISLAASTLARDEDGALLVAAFLGALIGLGGPAVYFSSTWVSGALLSRAWLLLSPLYGYTLLSEFFRTGSPAEFWLNTAIASGYSLALTCGTAWILRWTWREETAAFRLLPCAFGALWTRPRLVSKPAHADKPWLELDPYMWLALRDSRSVRLASAVVAVLIGAWLAAVLLWPKVWGTLLAAVFVAVLIYAAVGFVAMLSAAKTIGENRRSGSLELLLTTPLSVDEIVDGQRKALWIAFRPLLRCVFVLNAAVALALALIWNWDLLATTIALETWGILACLIITSLRSETVALVMWAALNCGRPWLAIRKVLCPPGLLVAFGFFVYSVPQMGRAWNFPQGSTAEFWLITPLLAMTVLLSILSGRWDPTTTRLREKFRRIAQLPVPEPSDPRFRQWDATRPFPERAGPPLLARL